MDKEINNNGYEYVDLGLPSGTLWATCNVGASKPTDYGQYFQWGDTQGYIATQIGKDKQFTDADYKWFLGYSKSGDAIFKKYAITGSTLELEDDAVHANMGGDWRMPSPTQIEELVDNTIAVWTTLDDVNGMALTSKKDASKSIFIPAAGFAGGGFYVGAGRYGCVWSSRLSSYNILCGLNLDFGLGPIYLGKSLRSDGFPVRGVIGNYKVKENNMDKTLNLVEILKDAPEGTKLWSPICGECELKDVAKDVAYPITCLAKNYVGQNESLLFTSKGEYTNQFAKGECVLFPSKENWDWSTFKIPKKHKHFKSFQKVLRIDDNNPDYKIWTSDFYSHYEETSGKHYLTSGFINGDDEIIPYDGNEDKVGTIVE